MLLDVLEVLFQVFGDRRVVPQHGQHIDKAKHLNFDGFVFHRPIHQAIFPPASVKNGRRAMSQPPKQLFPDFSCSLLNPVFNTNTFGHGISGIPLSGGFWMLRTKWEGRQKFWRQTAPKRT